MNKAKNTVGKTASRKPAAQKCAWCRAGVFHLECNGKATDIEFSNFADIGKWWEGYKEDMKPIIELAAPLILRAIFKL